MRIISLVLADREIARIDEEGNFKRMVEFQGTGAPNLLEWYNDCFYGISKSSTFDERFELVKEHNYFCYSKPELLLAARILP